MSEYQYYEFLAIDRPLTNEQIGELRKLSTRATITSTRFQNVYNWGDFGGDPRALMESYFDAFVYVANWGTRWFMLRFPRRLLDPETTSLYCGCDSFDALVKDDFVILEFLLEDESGGEWEDGEGWMESLVPLRSEIASGDRRALYLGWLLCAGCGFLEDDALEPPVPPGLSTLSATLESLAEFLCIDENLIAVAAERSAPLQEVLPSDPEMQQWVLRLPESEKVELLLRLVEGDPCLRAELLQRFQRSKDPDPELASQPRRTVAELLSAAEERAETRLREEEMRKAEEQARLERERAAARARHLDGLAGREAGLWQEVEALIQTKRPKDYDRAVGLLKDLRDLAARADGSEGFDGQMSRLRERHAGRPSLMARLNQAKLGAK